jgi:coenzyme F420-reducing hydrogenase delta subunit
MYNLSAAMGSRWAEICTEFTDRIKKLGPSPIWFARQRQQETQKRKK